MSISSITIHNSCKKIAQLNRVIEYLTSFLEEASYQISIMRQNVDADFQTIFKNHTDNMTSVLDTVTGQETNVSEAIKELFLKRIEEEKEKLNTKRGKISNYLNTEENAIVQEVKSMLSAVFLINQNIQNQIDVLNRGTLATDIQSSIKELEKKNKMEFRNFDQDNNVKISKFKENNAKQLKEMEAHFEKVKSDIKLGHERELHRNLNTNTQNNHLVSNFLKKREILTSQMAQAKKTLNKETTIAAQNFNAFKTRLHSMIDQMKLFKKETKAAQLAAKKKNEEKIEEMKKKQKEENINKKNTFQNFQNEITNLQNEQKMIRSKGKAEINQMQQKIQLKVQNGDSEIEDYQKSLLKKLEDAKVSNQSKEEDVKKQNKDFLESISHKRIEFDDEINKLKSSKAEKTSSFEAEIEKLRSDFEKDKQDAIALFHHNCVQFQKMIQNQEKSAEGCESAQKQLQTLQSDLKEIDENFQSSIQKIEYDSENQKDEEITKLAEQLEKSFGTKQKELNALIEQTKNEIELKESDFSAENAKRYDSAIDLVKKSFQDDSFKMKIKEYEAKYQQANKELMSIKSPPEDPISTLGEDLSVEYRRKRDEISDSIMRERTEMVMKYQNEYNQVNSKFPEKNENESENQVVDQEQNSNLNRIKANFAKRLSNMDIEIDELEKELLALKTIKPLTIFGDENDDEETTDLKLKLKTYCQKAEETIEGEKNRTEKLINALLSQIQIAQTQTMTSIKLEQSTQETDHKQFHETFQSQSNFRKSMRLTQEEQYNNIKDAADDAIRAKLNLFDRTVQDMNDTISLLREKLNISSIGAGNNDVSSRQIVEMDAIKMQFDDRFEKVKEQYDRVLNDLNNKRAHKVNEINQTISSIKERKDRAMNAVNAKPMRPEEKSIIDRLTQTLEEKTALLKSIGMEFLDFREGLAVRDEEFSRRFGRTPQVLESRNQKRRGTTAFARKKPLPPLAAAPNTFI